MSVEYLDLADYIGVASEITGLDETMVIKIANLDLADSALHAPAAGFGEEDFYPDFVDKAAVLIVRLAKNHPLPDGNKRCAFLATVEFLERNGRTWIPAPGDPDETDRVIRGIASGEVSEAAFRDWIAERIG